MNIIKYCLIAVSTLLFSLSPQAQTCIRIEKNKPLTIESDQPPGKDWIVPSTATDLVIYKQSGAEFKNSDVKARNSKKNVPKKNQEYILDAKLEQEISSEITKSPVDRSSFRITFIDDSGNLVSPAGGYPFYLASSESSTIERAKGCGNSSVEDAQSAAKSVPPPPANSDECTSIARNRGLLKNDYESWLIFNSAGNLCYAPDILRQRDRLHFVQLLKTGELTQPAARANITGCTTPTASPVLLNPPSSLSDFVTHSGSELKNGPTFFTLAQPVECASSSPVVTVTVTDSKGVEQAKSITLNLYDRYTATIHLGVLNSKLRNADYALRNNNGQTIIVNNETDKRGPEYTAMVVIQAIPRYFESGLAYPGRDILHDNEFKDRVGLVLSFGLKDPANRFGLGLGYELARGMNVVAVHEWFKQDQLSGVKEGEVFSGAATDIPKRKQWNKGWSLGLSFDLNYVTQVFGSKK